MFIKQLSLFVENKSGRLAEITSIIAGAGIDIRALSIADTTNFGILRIIVDKPDEAERILREDEGRACVILRVEDNAGAVKALQEGKIEILSEEKIYSL